MSSISSNKTEDRLRHLHGESDRNHSALGVGGAGGAAAKSTASENDDPISVSLHMEALDQNVVESNHKVSSAITFVQSQSEILNRFSKTFNEIAVMKSNLADSTESGQIAPDEYRQIVTGLPKVDDARFNNEPLFNADPLRVSIYHHKPEPRVSAVDLDRPDLTSITKVTRPEGIPVPLVNMDLETIPDPWLDEALAKVGDLIYSSNEQVIHLEEIRKTLNTGTEENVRGMDPPIAGEMVKDAGKLLLSSLDTGNAYKVQAHLSFGAVTAMLR